MTPSIEKRLIKISRFLCVLFAAAIIALGLSVIIGWVGHVSFLIRYQPNTIAMVVNTAVSFVLSGISALMILNGLKRQSLIFSLYVLLIGVLSLTQHVFNIDLGIDQLLFNHHDQIENTYPGRVAPNTALCFILAAFALIFATREQMDNTYIVLAGGFSALVFSFALLFFGGYFINNEHTYAWGTITPMAENTSIGFILLGMCLVCLIWNISLLHKLNFFRFAPVTIALCTFFIMLLLSVAVEEQQDAAGIESSLSDITFILGCVLAIIFGLCARFALFAYLSSIQAKEALSLEHAALEATADGIVVISSENKIVDVNKKFLQMWQLLRNDVILFNKDEINNAIKQQLKNPMQYELKIAAWDQNWADVVNDELELANGFSFEVVAKPQLLNDEIIGRVWSYRDVTVQRRLEAQLLHQATYDLLTDLPNKSLLLDLISRSINKAYTNRSSIIVILLDLDKFSSINDLLGRSKGDQLLLEVAHRIKGLLADNEIFGRYAGDEFILLKTDVWDKKYAFSTINKIFKAFLQPFDVYGKKISLSCCMGITLYPQDGKNLETLLSNADIAMLRAKKNGRNGFQFYVQDMNQFTLEHMEIENNLHEAVDKNQFILHYQPIVHVLTGKVTGMEALIRWQHPTKGLIAPNQFISIAEDIGLIGRIGEWVLETAGTTLIKLHAMGFTDLKISVNISAHQFKSGFFRQTVESILRKFEIDAKYIEFELTESILLDSTADIDILLNELHDLGIKLLLDDFGTGYSSLLYLKRFPIDTLKIDKMFVKNAVTIQEDRELITAIIAIAKAFNLRIIAEGVEEPDQLDLLKQLGCGYAQGYHIAKPMPIDKCIEFLKRF